MLAGWALVMALAAEVIMKITMEIFTVATTRDWILEVTRGQ